jgi:L-alanine-DL-glutamate epimerase-like enolase superfamily enzyme
MKLQTIETHIVKTPPPGFGGRYFIFVVLQTACGIRGYGEIYAASFAPETVSTMAADVFGRYLEGQNPFEIERFWRRAHGSGFSHRPDPSMQGVVSGLEMACWDIVGKALDRPVYDLLGGKVNERLRTYTYLYPRADQDAASFYNDASASAEAAAGYVSDGFTAVKFDPAGPTVFLMVASQIWTRFAGRKISAARFGQLLAIAPICCLARMANLPRLGDPACQAARSL